MKFSTTAIVFAVVLCAACFAEAKPTFITKKILLKKFVVPRVLSGEWKLPSLYVPYPLSLWWPSTSESASTPTVVYHSLPEDEVLIDNSTPEVQTVKDFNVAAAAQLQQQHEQLQLQHHQQQLPNEIGPIYIAETPAVRHVAPLPQGYTENVHTVNLQPAPGTTVA